MGSALLFSCKEEPKRAEDNLDAIMTEKSEHLTITVSENGRKSYRFTTPLLEGYTLGRDPYREFRRGIKIVTYQDDSLTSVNATLTANYAIYYEKRSLWEAKGDVVIVKHDSTKIFTQQLFWDSVTKRIYSNVDTKIETLTDTHFCEGFESDEEMNELSFRRWKGKVQMDESMMTPKDSVADNSVETPKEEPAEKPEPLPSRETVEKKRANRAKTLGKSDDGGKRAAVRKTGEASRREISRIE